MCSNTHFKLTFTASSTKHILVIFIFAALICISKANTEANKVKLVPLTAQKEYQLLGRSSNIHVIPEGRVVTQGIAAATGFTLGLMKALGAVFLYDVITANITEDATNQTVNTPLYSTQEICFGSRVDRSLKAAETVAEAYNRLEGKDDTLYAAVRKSQGKRLSKPKRNRNNKFANKNRHKRPQRLKVLRPTQSKNIVDTSQPSAANTVTGSLNESNLKAVSNIETTSSTTASSDNDHSITCIVIQKPKLK